MRLGLVDRDGEADADAAALATAPEEPSVAIEELMPTSWPLALTSAPPLLPGLIAARGLDRVGHDGLARLLLALAERVLLLGCPPGSVVTGRFSALTMPVVTVPARPSGLPTAMTGSPTLSASESPSAIGREVARRRSCRVMTARSVEGSVPTTVAAVGAAVVEGHRELGAGHRRPSRRGCWSGCGPCASMMTPEPWPPPCARRHGDRHDAGGRRRPRWRSSWGACGSAWSTGRGVRAATQAGRRRSQWRRTASPPTPAGSRRRCRRWRGRRRAPRRR